jgi:hypothetical protein
VSDMVDLDVSWWFVSGLLELPWVFLLKFAPCAACLSVCKRIECIFYKIL